MSWSPSSPCCSSLVWPVASLGVILAMAQEAMTASARILEIFDTEPDIVSRRAA